MTTTPTLRHELRTLVNHIVGYTELLQDEIEGPHVEFLYRPLDAVRADAAEALAAIDCLAAGAPPEAACEDPKAALEGALDRIVAQVAVLNERVATLGREATSVDLLRVEFAARHARALVAHPLISAGAAAMPAGPPPERARPPAARETAERSPARPTTGTVLVVDDDATNRDVLARRLEGLGHTVVTARTGREALEILGASPVDLVLLDLMMPEMHGIEVLEVRRNDPALRDIPFVMISAHDEADRVAGAIEMGAEDYLPKPFDPVLLEARVGACLEKKWLRDQEKDLLATVQQQAAQLAELNETLEARVCQQVEEIGRLTQLRRFLSPQLADVIVSSQNDATLQSHRREIAVLFCDLRGFTAFAETNEPEEVMSVLSDFHHTVGALIHRFEATVGFFAGDGLMVFFNDPLPCPDPAARAVQLGVAMGEHVAGLIPTWQARGYGLGFAVGVAFGYATLGEMGFEGRYDYGVIGSVVNLAARLCGQAAPGQILISGRTRVAVEAEWEVESIGELSLKGFRDKVPAFQVVGPRSPGQQGNPAAGT